MSASRRPSGARIVCAIGLALLAASGLGGWLVADGAAEALQVAARLFVPLWLIASAYHLWVDFTQAEAPPRRALPLFLAICLLPSSAVACVFWAWA